MAKIDRALAAACALMLALLSAQAAHADVDCQFVGGAGSCGGASVFPARRAVAEAGLGQKESAPQKAAANAVAAIDGGAQTVSAAAAPAAAAIAVPAAPGAVTAKIEAGLEPGWRGGALKPTRPSRGEPGALWPGADSWRLLAFAVFAAAGLALLAYTSRMRFAFAGAEAAPAAATLAPVVASAKPEIASVAFRAPDHVDIALHNAGDATAFNVVVNAVFVKTGLSALPAAVIDGFREDASASDPVDLAAKKAHAVAFAACPGYEEQTGAAIMHDHFIGYFVGDVVYEGRFAETFREPFVYRIERDETGAVQACASGCQ